MKGHQRKKVEVALRKMGVEYKVKKNSDRGLAFGP